MSCTPFVWGGKRIEAHIMSVGELAPESNQNGVFDSVKWAKQVNKETL
jgi:hypothetical protein